MVFYGLFFCPSSQFIAKNNEKFYSRVEILRPNQPTKIVTDEEEIHETELSLLRNSRKDGMVSMDPTLPYTNDDEGESPAYLNGSSERGEQAKDVSYETDYNSIFWGMLNRDGKGAIRSVVAGDVQNLNETLTDGSTKLDGMNTALKTDVPEVEKLINAGRYFFFVLPFFM